MTGSETYERQQAAMKAHTPVLRAQLAARAAADPGYIWEILLANLDAEAAA